MPTCWTCCNAIDRAQFFTGSVAKASSCRFWKLHSDRHHNNNKCVNYSTHSTDYYYYYYYYKRWCLKWHNHAQTLQGHLTNTKQSRVDSDVAQVLASSSKDVLNSTVFSWCRKSASDCLSLTKDSGSMGSSNWKCTVSQSPSSRSWNDQCQRVSRTQATAGITAGCQMQGLGEVPWRCTMKAYQTDISSVWTLWVSRISERASRLLKLPHWQSPKLSTQTRPKLRWTPQIWCAGWRKADTAVHTYYY